MIGDLTPREIVLELDRYIIGQKNAKRSVAIALRNRARRKALPEELREEVGPKNILMIGPTGVGKTEIARRLSKLSNAPFLKVEASKFTEVGYVGRDVESIIRDLVELAMGQVRSERMKNESGRAARAAEHRLIETLMRDSAASEAMRDMDIPQTVEGVRQALREGKLDKISLTISPAQVRPQIEIFGANMGGGLEGIEAGLQNMLNNIQGSPPGPRKLNVPEAMKTFIDEESQKLVNPEAVAAEAINRVQNSGIVFIDEIDKVAGRDARGPDVSREGVQRDLLPIIEGTSVVTKHGVVKTDHILFIGAGAFHVAKPSDLIPELQGRFPIRVELENLGQVEFERILKEPKNALVIQYKELLKTEGINLKFTDDAIRSVAAIAKEVNEGTESIGARRLHTVMEKLLEKISFDAPELKDKNVDIDAQYVQDQLADLVRDRDLLRYIL